MALYMPRENLVEREKEAPHSQQTSSEAPPSAFNESLIHRRQSILAPNTPIEEDHNRTIYFSINFKE